ncbi:MAG: MATE family efflux transporter [Solobacterium sp.]|nr:MATE family efflux transporter [Solobacterium sp.]
MASITQQIDMTYGSCRQKIVAFAIPMLIGNVAQQLYNTADSVIVGKFIGDNALAAVGSAGPIMNLLFVLIIGISTGAGIVVAKYFGARQQDDLARSIGACIFVTAAASLFIMCMTPFVIRPMLKLVNTPPSVLDWCAQYLTIVFLGIAGNAFYFILGAILRGLGDSFSALVYLFTATVINTVLDYIFVAHVGLGVPGVAYATVIAQFISAILSLRKLMHMDCFKFEKEMLKPNMKYIRELIRVGLPSGLTQVIFSMSSVVVQSLINSFGEMFIAANVIVMRIDGFVMMPTFSFGSAMTTFAAQNVGAAKMDRVEQGAREGTMVAVGTSIVLVSLIFMFGKPLMHIFTSTEELVQLSYSMLKILMIGYVAMAYTQSVSGVMRGAGDTVTPMIISMVTTILIRVPLAYLISWMTRTPDLPNGSSSCIFISLLISWVLGAAMTALAFRRGKWKKKAFSSLN